MEDYEIPLRIFSLSWKLYIGYSKSGNGVCVGGEYTPETKRSLGETYSSNDIYWEI